MRNRITQNDFEKRQPSERKFRIEGGSSTIIVRPDNPLSNACAFVVISDGDDDESCAISLTPDEARAMSLALDILADEHLTRQGR